MSKHDIDEYNKKELEPLPVIYEISASVKGKIFHILFLLILCFGSLYLYKKIPLDGFWLDNLLSLKKSIFFHKKISFNLMAYPLRFIGLGSLVGILYIWLDQSRKIFRITDKHLEKQAGIISVDINRTDLVKIEDAEFERSIYDRIFGLAKIRIFAPRDKTDPVLLIKDLLNEEAYKLYNYIDSNSVNNITEYKIKKDKQKARDEFLNKKTNSKNNDSDEIIDDGEGYDN